MYAILQELKATNPPTKGNDIMGFSQETRQAEFANSNYTCRNCGDQDRNGHQGDHIVPASMGISNDKASNCQTLCSTCNMIKGDTVGMPELPIRQAVDLTAITAADYLTMLAVRQAAFAARVKMHKQLFVQEQVSQAKLWVKTGQLKSMVSVVKRWQARYNDKTAERLRKATVKA
jgi:hypothetical protein